MVDGHRSSVFAPFARIMATSWCAANFTRSAPGVGVENAATRATTPSSSSRARRSESSPRSRCESVGLFGGRRRQSRDHNEFRATRSGQGRGDLEQTGQAARRLTDGHDRPHLGGWAGRSAWDRPGDRLVEGRILLQDLALKLRQSPRRLEAQVADQCRPHPAICVKRIGLPAGSVVRQHQQSARPLS